MNPLAEAEKPPSKADSAAAPAWSQADLARDPHAAPDKAVRVERMFAAIARRYDLNNRLHSFGRDKAWRRKAVRLAGVGPGDRVLDVACGTGDLTLEFAASRPASVTGLDFTAAMLDIARAKAARAAHRIQGPQPEFVQGDAMNLPFADASFDIVSIAFGIRNVADPMRALREFRRVLGPGGRMVVLEFTKPPSRVIRIVNDLYTCRIMPITASWIAGDRSGAYRYLPKSVAAFPSASAFAEMVAAAGFDPPRLTPLTFGVCAVYVGTVPVAR